MQNIANYRQRLHKKNKNNNNSATLRGSRVTNMCPVCSWKQLRMKIEFRHVMLVACTSIFMVLSFKIVVQFAENQTVSRYSTMPLEDLDLMPALSICIPYKPGLEALPLVIEMKEERKETCKCIV